MQYTSSQEQTIYRSLAGQLQLGFFQDGEGNLSQIGRAHV